MTSVGWRRGEKGRGSFWLDPGFSQEKGEMETTGLAGPRIAPVSRDRPSYRRWRFARLR